MMQAYIVTRRSTSGRLLTTGRKNKKDFKASTIPVLTAAEFFDRIDSKF